jgi:hypothetical protein
VLAWVMLALVVVLAGVAVGARIPGQPWSVLFLITAAPPPLAPQRAPLPDA